MAVRRGRDDRRDRPYGRDASRGSGGDGGGAHREPAPISVHIPEELAGGVIGKGGQVIGDIRRQSGARVQMDHTQRHERLGTRVVTMSGEPNEIASAESLIGEVLDKSCQEKGLRNMVGIDLPLRFFVPEEAVGHIIGWEGAAVREIEQRSHATLDIGGKNSATRPGFRNVSVQGLPSQVLRAQCLIAAVVSEKLGASVLPFAVDGGDTSGGPGMGGPMGGGRGVPPGSSAVEHLIPGGIDDRQEMEVSLSIVNEAVGVIIGRGGQTVKDLELQTSTRIDMMTEKNKALPPGEPRMFNIRGTKQRILRVQQMMGELLDRSQVRFYNTALVN